VFDCDALDVLELLSYWLPLPEVCASTNMPSPSRVNPRIQRPLPNRRLPALGSFPANTANAGFRLPFGRIRFFFDCL